MRYEEDITTPVSSGSRCMVGVSPLSPLVSLAGPSLGLIEGKPHMKEDNESRTALGAHSDTPFVDSERPINQEDVRDVVRYEEDFSTALSSDSRWMVGVSPLSPSVSLVGPPLCWIEVKPLLKDDNKSSRALSAHSDIPSLGSNDCVNGNESSQSSMTVCNASFTTSIARLAGPPLRLIEVKPLLMDDKNESSTGLSARCDTPSLGSNECVNGNESSQSSMTVCNASFITSITLVDHAEVHPPDNPPFASEYPRDEEEDLCATPSPLHSFPFTLSPFGSSEFPSFCDHHDFDCRGYDVASIGPDHHCEEEAVMKDEDNFSLRSVSRGVVDLALAILNGEDQDSIQIFPLIEQEHGGHLRRTKSEGCFTVVHSDVTHSDEAESLMEGTYTFVGIVGHKVCKKSRGVWTWVAHVKWSNSELTWEPLDAFCGDGCTLDGLVAVRRYGRQHNLLGVRRWRKKTVYKTWGSYGLYG